MRVLQHLANDDKFNDELEKLAQSIYSSSHSSISISQCWIIAMASLLEERGVALSYTASTPTNIIPLKGKHEN
jgi:hypothetical protein